MRRAPWRRLVARAAVTLALAVVSVGALVRRAPDGPVRIDPAVVTAPVRLAGSVVRAPTRSFLTVRALSTTGAAVVGRAEAGADVSVSLTAYCLRGTTRRSNPVRPGIIAADPRVFPLGSRVELWVGTRYLGRFLVDDTGGAIKGNKLDIWTPRCREALRFGRRKGRAVLVAREAPPAPTPEVDRLLPH